MYTSAAIVLGVMVLFYFIALRFKLSTELAMLVAALAGAAAGGHFFPARHVAEGAITYMDINLIFFCATLFMNILKESGGVAYAVRSIIKTFHKSRVLLLILLAFLLLIPGALTGAGSVTVLIVGSMVAVVLNYMGGNQDQNRCHYFSDCRVECSRTAGEPVGHDDCCRGKHALCGILLATADSLCSRRIVYHLLPRMERQQN